MYCTLFLLSYIFHSTICCLLFISTLYTIYYVLNSLIYKEREDSASYSYPSTNINHISSPCLLCTVCQCKPMCTCLSRSFLLYLFWQIVCFLPGLIVNCVLVCLDFIKFGELVKLKQSLRFILFCPKIPWVFCMNFKYCRYPKIKQ